MIQNILWHNIPIEIDYNPDYSKAYREAYGYSLAHIKIQADRPLPITSTGFKSQFMAEPLVAEYGTVERFVRKILDTTAQSPEWKQTEAAQNQLNLF